MLVPEFAQKAGVAAHSFRERCLGYGEMARWAPGACNDDDRLDVFRQFVDTMDERFRTSIRVFQTIRIAAIKGEDIILSGQQADNYETDIRKALLASEKWTVAEQQPGSRMPAWPCSTGPASSGSWSSPSSGPKWLPSKRRPPAHRQRLAPPCRRPPQRSLCRSPRGAPATKRRRAAAHGSALCVGHPRGAPRPAVKRRHAAAHGSALFVGRPRGAPRPAAG